MPIENTDRQNELLYIFNRVLVELKDEYEDDAPPVVQTTRARNILFNEDGLFIFNEYNLARQPRTIAQMIDIINMDPFLDSDEWRDAVEKRRWPDRIELDDVHLIANLAWDETFGHLSTHGIESYVFVGDEVYHSTGNGKPEPYKVDFDGMDINGYWENKRWPNRVELFDINFIGSNEREAAVYTKQGTFYVSARGDSYPWTWPNAVGVKNSWEKSRWPNRYEQSDILLIGNVTKKNHPGYNCCYVYFADGGYGLSHSKHLATHKYDVHARDFFEEQRWPNRISMDDVAFISDCSWTNESEQCTHVTIKEHTFVSRPYTPYTTDQFNKI